MKTPELLLPAGSYERMVTAFDYGADAVYAGLPRYSLRARNNEFSTIKELGKGIKEAHKRNKKFFLASNIIPHNSKLKTFLNDIKKIIELKPDALIMADPGLIMKVKENWPYIPIHLSVQANTTNYWSVEFWKKIGISRIILSRELSLEEIIEIKKNCPNIELEVFVHGALCIAYSGRCLLSGYFNHRDPNQGTCTNSCRWEYNIYQEKNDNNNIKRHPLANETYYLSETNKPNSLLPITEDENGTYIMNSKDLRAIEIIDKLVNIGIDSLKIEGRTKSIYYVARVTQSYRKAINDAVLGKDFDTSLLSELEGLANRGYTTGFLERHQTQDYQNYLSGHSTSKKSIYAGKVIDIDSDGWATIDVKNKFAVGDNLEIIHPSGNNIINLKKIIMNDKEINVASGNGIIVKIPNMSGKNKALIAKINK